MIELQNAVATVPGDTSKADAIAMLTLMELATKIQSREVTSVQATQACLHRIAIYNPKLDAFITVMTELALKQARERDAELQGGRSKGLLHGVPIAVKDNIDTAGTRTTGGSALFEDRIPDVDATVITRLKDAGAVIIGKTNMMEFAGVSTESFWGFARNPWDLRHETGGSSTGSGVAVATDLCYAALGTDTGGSVRHPAAWCSVVGLKVTNGLVPIRGILPLTLSLDTCGPLTKRVEDAAAMLNAMAGYDRLDIMSVPHPREDYVAGMKQSVKKMRVGLPVGHFDVLHPDTRAAFDMASRLIASFTAGVEEMVLPSVGDAISLGPYSETYAFHEEYFRLEPGKYQTMSRKTLEANEDLDAAPYIRAMWEMKLARRTVDDAFGRCDLLMLPTMHSEPTLLRKYTAEDLSTAPKPPRAFADSMLFNVLGLPAISIPCGFSANGLPIGLEIAGPPFSESKILALAYAYQSATTWHLQRPPLTPSTPKPELS